MILDPSRRVKNWIFESRTKSLSFFFFPGAGKKNGFFVKSRLVGACNVPTVKKN